MYKDNRDVFILGNIDELKEALEDSMLQISNIVSAKYSSPFRSAAEMFQKRLRFVDEALEQWL
jgi:hypothetical protein